MYYFCYYKIKHLKMKVTEKKKFLHSLVFPIFFIFVIWIVKISELILNTSYSQYGIYPLEIKGLLGVILAPLIHGDFDHLFANSVPLLVLTTAIFYFYSKVSYRIFFLSYLITGIWVWVSARASHHIGASGLVYAFAAFLIISGIIRKNKNFMALSFIIVFLYGSMIWGVLPSDPKISWESHLLGMFAGILLAIYYRKEKLPWVRSIKVFRFKEYMWENKIEEKTD